MYNFDYILDKIVSAPFSKYPFKHIYLENFLSDEHFKHIVNSEQIKLTQFSSTEELISALLTKNYSPVSFPGCTADVIEYITWFNGDRTARFKNDLIEGRGMSMRMTSYDDQLLSELLAFLNSDKFHNAIKNKFKKTLPTRVETAIQKYLTGYEISPHMDVRKKCLTYMVNINPGLDSENLEMHTHYLKFKTQYEKLYSYWENNTDVDRCWVPWDWCTSEFKQTKNNTMVMFAPGNDTIHAVKADYDHLLTQRTQIYGNLWYDPYVINPTAPDKFIPMNWRDLKEVL
jgi:hypothetical protein